MIYGRGDTISKKTTKKNTKSEVPDIQNKKPSIIRCPKCRSINPPGAQYCLQCGKVFKSKS